MIVPPHLFVASGAGKRDEPVVAPVADIVRPAVRCPDGAQFQAGAGARALVGAVEGLQQAKAPDRRGAVALTLGMAWPRASKGAGQGEIAGLQPSPPVVERG